MSHAVYDTSYHLVWAPKYRTWILKGNVRDAVKELFQDILVARDCEIVEMEIGEDHVHIFTSIPPRYAIGEIVRILKSVSAREIFVRYPEVKRELRSGEFWEDGYLLFSVYKKLDSKILINLNSQYVVSKSLYSSYILYFVPYNGTTQKDSKFPHECVACGSPAYIGGQNNCECSNSKCQLFCNK